MASNAHALYANTAASLLHYEKYTKTGTTEECWTRFSSANEEFNVVSSGGQKFLIKFHANFSKKHLVTFSKKQWATEKEAWLQSQQPGQQGKEAENWNRAQNQLLNNKILKTLGVRSGQGASAVCVRCGHKKSNNPDKTGHSAKSGKCMVPGCDGVTCVGGYVSSYIEARTNKGKPEVDPYAGASGQDSSCLVLNWIPLAEFTKVVGDSIEHTDPGNGLADSAPKPYGFATPFYHLKWEFVGRPGAVRKAANGALVKDDGTWCEVGAFKDTSANPLGITATWIIAHWNGMG